MKNKIPIAVLLLTAATFFVGGSAAAQKSPVSYAGGPGPTAPVHIGGYGDRYGHGIRVRPRPAPRRIWVPGHYELVMKQVWVPGWTEKIWVEPVYEWRDDYRRGPYRVLIRPGHWRDVYHPGHYEMQRVRVWRPGYWRTGWGVRR